MIKVKGEVRPQSPDTEYMYIIINHGSFINQGLAFVGWIVPSWRWVMDLNDAAENIHQQSIVLPVLYQVKEVALTAHGASE